MAPNIFKPLFLNKVFDVYRKLPRRLIIFFKLYPIADNMKYLNMGIDQDDCFFEMKIEVDEITKDVSIIVTDFAEEDEVEEAKMLWESQISDLKQVIGSSQ